MHLRLVCAVIILGGVWPFASATPPSTTVYPTGSFPLDVDNVQAAIDGGGTVILKATNSIGQPTAFNFGPADRHNGTGANLTTNVTILGERVGQSMTTINGGFAPFLGFLPVKTHIEGIDFEGPMDSPIVIISSTGAEIVGNRISGIIPDPLPPPIGFTEAEGIFVSGFDDPEHAITGRVRVADNIIEMSAGDFANGMQFDEVSADIEISGNDVHFLQSNGLIQTIGILVFRSHGKANVVNNLVTMGRGDPDVIPSAIFVGGHAEARYLISRNTVITEHPNLDGIDVLGFSFSGATQNAVIEGNHIVMQSLRPDSGGIFFGGAVKNSLMSANRIEGVGGNAIQMDGFGSTFTAESNRALGNDISQFSALGADVFFGPFSIDNLYAGQCATYVDLGVGNRITCGQPLIP